MHYPFKVSFSAQSPIVDYVSDTCHAKSILNP